MGSAPASGGSRLFQNGLKLGLVGAALVVWALQAGRQPRPQHHPADCEPAGHESLKLQKMRAAEPMRGRNAEAPWQIPWLGWKDIFWRLYQQLNKDRILAVAAGVVFFA